MGHANISQTSTYLQSTAKSLNIAIEKKEQYERDLADARRRHVEQQAAAAQGEEGPGGTTVPADLGSDRIQ